MASRTVVPASSQAAPPAAPPRTFTYVLTPPQLTALQAGVPARIQLDSDFDFIVERYTATSSGLFSIYLQDASRGVPLMSSLNTPVNGENISGPASLPYWLAKEMRLRRGTQIEATFNDRSNALNTIVFALVGRKVS